MESLPKKQKQSRQRQSQQVQANNTAHAAVAQAADQPQTKPKRQQSRKAQLEHESEPDRDSTLEEDDTGIVAEEFDVQFEKGPESLHGTLGDGCTDPLMLSAMDHTGEPAVKTCM